MNGRRSGSETAGEQNSAYRPALKLHGQKHSRDPARRSGIFHLIGQSNSTERHRGKMANRKGVFIGAYVPSQLKEALQQRAKAEHRTLSQEITRILEEAIRGRRLPPGFVDRRNETSGPRRRTSDPLPRRRVNDVPSVSSDSGSSDD